MTLKAKLESNITTDPMVSSKRVEVGTKEGDNNHQLMSF